MVNHSGSICSGYVVYCRRSPIRCSAVRISGPGRCCRSWSATSRTVRSARVSVLSASRTPTTRSARRCVAEVSVTVIGNPVSGSGGKIGAEDLVSNRRSGHLTVEQLLPDRLDEWNRAAYVDLQVVRQVDLAQVGPAVAFSGPARVSVRVPDVGASVRQV